MIRMVRVIDEQGTRHIVDYSDFTTRTGTQRHVSLADWTGLVGKVFRKNHQIRVGRWDGSESVWVEV